MQQRRKAIFKYGDARHLQSERCVSPLGCFFWGDGWTLVAWCDTR
ncbi:MAG: WYL domain-containing protein, partial [Limnohabitans sp.]